MRVHFAHLREMSTTGRYVDFAIFDANASSGLDSERANVLASLTTSARMALRLKIDASALVFVENGQQRTYGDHFVVDYLTKAGVPAWTHFIDV